MDSKITNERRSESAQAGSLDAVLRGILREWEAEADLLKSGNHPRRQGLPRQQVLQEECALRGCVADIKRALDASNEKGQRMTPPETSDCNRDAPASFAAPPGSVRTCEVCGRAMTAKRYDHGDDHWIYWTCDLAEGAWAHGAQHTREDAPENKKAPNDKVSV